MLHIYCDKLTPRVEYIFKIFFRHAFQLEYQIFNDLEEFTLLEGDKLCYSLKNLPDSVHVHPAQLLFEHEINIVETHHGFINGGNVLFHHNEPSDLPYDPFASAFYMVSRYEEYLDFTPDEFDRFPLHESLAFKFGFHKKAIVHHWALEVVNLLRKQYPQLEFKQNKYQFTPTFDIDNAYAFKHKNLVRTIGGMIKSLFTDKTEFKERIKVVFLGENDPYNNYQYISDQNDKHGLRGIYFFLTADYGGIDNNISPSSKAFKNLVTDLSRQGEIGLHPSYTSNFNALKWDDEMNLLVNASKKDVQNSRQHYLTLKFPKTYRDLSQKGIKNDFSMGFAEEAGFRAGISIPFPFFDLSENREMKLMIHPFAFMEASYMYYNKLDYDAIIEEFTSITKEIKAVNGHFYSIWHNESLSDKGKWKDWRKIFEKLYETAGSI